MSVLETGFCQTKHFFVQECNVQQAHFKQPNCIGWQSFYRPPAPPMQVKETQKSISDWANETFGPVKSRYRIAVRVNKEMAELLDKLAIDDNDPNAIEEAADVVIVAMRLFQEAGIHFWDAVEAKMVINRARKWKADGTGCGQHV